MMAKEDFTDRIHLDPKDAAIAELAHIARSLLTACQETGNVPGIFIEAITNKIDYYAAKGE